MTIPYDSRQQVLRAMTDLDNASATILEMQAKSGRAVPEAVMASERPHAVSKATKNANGENGGGDENNASLVVHINANKANTSSNANSTNQPKNANKSTSTTAVSFGGGDGISKKKSARLQVCLCLCWS